MSRFEQLSTGSAALDPVLVPGGPARIDRCLHYPYSSAYRHNCPDKNKRPVAAALKNYPSLPKPARYFPLNPGGYGIEPGLGKLGKDFGNGDTDGKLFQFDTQFETYRLNTLTARQERLGKYVCHSSADGAETHTANLFIAKQLATEHPHLFHIESTADRLVLNCQLSGDRLAFRYDGTLDSGPATIMSPETGGFSNGWDALGCQVQEDMALVNVDQAINTITALHLCAANHWGAEQKLGQSFLDAHAAVPRFTQRYFDNNKLIQGLITKGPYTRFAWGLATDCRLNHHPVAPEHGNTDDWHGRRFDPVNPQLFLRVERQCMQGIPDTRQLLFTIRTYFLDTKDILHNKDEAGLLISSIKGMDGASLRYKGLAADSDAIINWLETLLAEP